MTKVILTAGALLFAATPAIAAGPATNNSTVTATATKAIQVGNQNRSGEATGLKLAIGKNGTGDLIKVKALNSHGSTNRPLINVSTLNKSGGQSGRLANVSLLNGSDTKGSAPINVSTSTLTKR